MASNPIKVIVRSGLAVKVGRGPQGASGVTSAAAVHAATSKTTPVDADETMLVDSAATFGLKRLTFANLKTWVLSFLGSAAETDSTAYATAAQGALAASAKQPGTTLAHYGITDAATSAQGSLAASASQPGHTHTALECSASRAIEKKTSTFTAVVGGQYLVTGIAVLVATPSLNASGGALTAGDSFIFWACGGAGNGVAIEAPTMRACMASIFPYRVVYDGAAWGIEASFLSDALDFAASAKSATLTNLGGGAAGVSVFGAATQAAAISALGCWTVPAATQQLDISQGTTGPGTVSVSGTAVTGVGTLFTKTFRVGDTITVTTTSGTETKAITTITSDTVLVTAAFAGTAAAGTAWTKAERPAIQFFGNGNAVFTGTRDATSTSSASVVFSGGIAVAGYVWGSNVRGANVFSSTSFSAFSGSKYVASSNVVYGWTSANYDAAIDTATSRISAGLVGVGTGAAGSFAGSLKLTNLTSAGYLEGSEIAAPAAPAANGYRIFAEDNGAGKTRLMVQFATGAAQQIAIEP